MLYVSSLFNDSGKVLPSIGGCASMWEGVSQCGRVCPSVGGCPPVWEGVPQCGRVCPSVGGFVPVWEGVSQCGRVCPSIRGCPPVWEGVPLYVLVHVLLLVTCTYDGHTSASVCSSDYRTLRPRGEGLRS